MKTFDTYEGAREIRECVGDIDLSYLIDGDTETIIARLRKFEEDILTEGTYKSVTFETHYMGYDGGVQGQVFGIRDETEKEITTRVEKNKKDRERHEKKKAKDREKRERDERKELARLQKKYKGK